jgi:hypothetical protein
LLQAKNNSKEAFKKEERRCVILFVVPGCIQEVKIACQNPLRLSSLESGRYNLEMITFWKFRNATFIAAIEPSQDRFHTLLDVKAGRFILR